MFVRSAALKGGAIGVIFAILFGPAGWVVAGNFPPARRSAAYGMIAAAGAVAVAPGGRPPQARNKGGHAHSRILGFGSRRTHPDRHAARLSQCHRA
jgi:hypothetical protein